MALALGTIKLTPGATGELIKEGPVSRAAYFERWLDGIGGKLLGYYFAENSDIDIITVMELPDEIRTDTAKSIAAWAANWSTGMSQRLEITWLATPKDFEAALKAASAIAAPGRD